MLTHLNLKVKKMKRLYKNKLDLSWTPNPLQRIKDISKEIINHSDYLPKTLSYEDIDRSFKDWVESEIVVIQDGIKLPTMVLYSNQRFSEYMQTWQYTDENNNVRLNFKTVTRENNPSHGTILGDTYNIPGERYYKLKSIPAIDDSGKKYRVDYKMKQPTPVDFNYKISIMTNRYTSINDFNEKIQQLFNARQSYICPNGHYMSITLESISDESEYNIEDRQFFSQTVNVKIKGYIIKESDFIIEENPYTSIVCFEGEQSQRKSSVELYEYDACFDENENSYKKDIELDVKLSFCYPNKGKSKFTIDEDFILTDLILKDDSNIVDNTIKLYINDVLISDNLLLDAFEGYRKCDNKPYDSTEYNTLMCDELPNKKNRDYKYILYNNEYFIWHQIRFVDGDEITIKTNKIKRHLHDGNLLLKGYNKLIISF